MVCPLCLDSCQAHSSKRPAIRYGNPSIDQTMKWLRPAKIPICIPNPAEVMTSSMPAGRSFRQERTHPASATIPIRTSRVPSIDVDTKPCERNSLVASPTSIMPPKTVMTRHIIRPAHLIRFVRSCLFASSVILNLFLYVN